MLIVDLLSLHSLFQVKASTERCIASNTPTDEERNFSYFYIGI